MIYYCIKYGTIPLHSAAERSSHKCLEVLLSLGATVNNRNNVNSHTIK